MRAISGTQYQFATSDALALLGADLFVANYYNCVAEVDASTGTLVKVISPSTSIRPVPIG